VYFIAVCGVLLVICWQFRVPLLTGLAQAWSVNQPLQKADVILVLGGGVDVRPFAAAKDYNDGVAPKILVASPPLKRTAKLGLAPGHGELNREVLLHEGVPPEAIEMITASASNTYQEAIAVREWAAVSKAKFILIPTEFIHARRTRWVFDQVLRGTDITIVIQALEPPEYTLHNWWQKEDGIVAFQNEVLKYFYYRLKY